MAKHKRLYFDILTRLAETYRKNAELCLEVGGYFAGLTSVRAALEVILYSRFLVGLLDLPPEELQALKVRISDSEDVFDVPTADPTLKEMIDVAKGKGLINESGRKAAHRIREWGNKIHGSQVACAGRFPAIGRRNLKARLNDLSIVAKQLLKTL